MQDTQNRDTRAIQLELDEILCTNEDARARRPRRASERDDLTHAQICRRVVGTRG